MINMPKLKIEFDDFKKEVEISDIWWFKEKLNDLLMELENYISLNYPVLEDEWDNTFIGWF